VSRTYLLARVSFVALTIVFAAGGTARMARAQDSVPKPAARRDRDVISAEELAAPALRSQTVYEVVKRLRPNFLTSRGTAVRQQGSTADPEAGQVHASVDGNSVTAIGDLRTMSIDGVIEIRFLSAGQAMQRFGGAAREGPVILVRTM